VKQFDIAQAFVERCANTEPLDALKCAFRKAIHELGFRDFSCCSHVDPATPRAQAVVFQSYPAEWIRFISETRLYVIDPVRCYAARSLLPFFWDSKEFRASLTAAQENFLIKAESYGIAGGYTVPLHRPGSPVASCSVIPHSETKQPASFGAIQIMASFMYEALHRNLPDMTVSNLKRLRLSNRERQCLEIAAQGKSDWEIAKIVGISERTVHAHIEKAKRRLGVTTRVQAIVQSLFEHQLSFCDVITNSFRPPKASELHTTDHSPHTLQREPSGNLRSSNMIPRFRTTCVSNS